MVLSDAFKRVFIAEATQPFAGAETIAVVAGSFKPPTAAHWDMVQKYADMADRVVVLVSDPKKRASLRTTATGRPVSPQQAVEVFEIYAKRYGLADKVEARVSSRPSPVSAAFEFIDSLKEKNVVLGVSMKDGDESRFATVQARYAGSPDVYLYDPLQTAVEPFTAAGKPMSAADARAAMDDPEAFAEYMPARLTPADIQAVEAALGVGGVQMRAPTRESGLEPLDESEELRLEVSDELLAGARMAAWNTGTVAVDSTGKETPVNPKKFPERAVRVSFEDGPALVEVFLDGKTRRWDSEVQLAGQTLKLSPDQLGSFFGTAFYRRLRAKLRSNWPLSDEQYSKLFAAVDSPEISIPRAPVAQLAEDGDDRGRDEKDAYTDSGRKIASFSPQTVSSKSAEVQCWPRFEHEFDLGQWKNPQYMGNLCKLVFKHSNGHEYKITLSPLVKDWDLRGFRGLDDTQQPPVQWLTKDELAEVRSLPLFQKFCTKCAKRILHYAKMDPEEVAKKVGKPKRLTADDVANTQRIMRKTAREVVVNKQIDTFRWK